MKKLITVLGIALLAILLCSCKEKEYVTTGEVDLITEKTVEIVTDNTSPASAIPIDVPKKLLPDHVAVGDMIRITYTMKGKKINEILSAELLFHHDYYQGSLTADRIPANKVDDAGWMGVPMVIDAMYDDCFLACPTQGQPFLYKVNYTGQIASIIQVGNLVNVTLLDVYKDDAKGVVEGTLGGVEAPIYTPNGNEPVCYKPVIYLYPEKETDVTVSLEGVDFTCTYPKYENGWHVTALPDGTLKADGKEYNYLYWEGLCDLKNDLSEGFCVKGEETAVFLEKTLEKLGLTRREANEFIVYWLPLMEGNAYNVISFQKEGYTDAARLFVSPAPDTVIRVFMTWYGSTEKVEIPEQKPETPLRTGFTVVEWGGTELR